MQAVRFAVGCAFGVAFVFVGVKLQGGNFATLIDWRSLLLVIAGGLGAGFLSHSPSDVMNALMTSLGIPPRNNGNRTDTTAVLTTFGKAFPISGVVVGLIHAIHALQTNSTSQVLAVGLVAASLPILYGCCFRMFVWGPTRTQLASSNGNRAGTSNNNNQDRPHLRIAS